MPGCCVGGCRPHRDPDITDLKDAACVPVVRVFLTVGEPAKSAVRDLPWTAFGADQKDYGSFLQIPRVSKEKGDALLLPDAGHPFRQGLLFIVGKDEDVQLVQSTPPGGRPGCQGHLFGCLHEFFLAIFVPFDPYARLRKVFQVPSSRFNVQTLIVFALDLGHWTAPIPLLPLSIECR